jgi:hypothetical protein
VSENFSTLMPYKPELGRAILAGAHRFAVPFLHAHWALIEERTERGFVRDCHGDLRAEHVLVEDGGVAVFDPVEFDPALREIDVSADLAFLVMDLLDRGADDLADTLVRVYEAAGGDHGGRPLLHFYAAYRALVRAKVACLRGGELPPGEARSQSLAEARRLAALARRLAWCASRPLVLVFCGASATGKTHLAEAVSTLSGLPRLSSDLVRKELSAWGRRSARRKCPWIEQLASGVDVRRLGEGDGLGQCPLLLTRRMNWGADAVEAQPDVRSGQHHGLSHGLQAYRSGSKPTDD